MRLFPSPRLLLVVAASVVAGCLLGRSRGVGDDSPPLPKGVTATDVAVEHVRAIAKNATVGSDAVYRFRGGGMLVLKEGVTLDFAGTIDAGPHRIFQLARGARVDFSRSRMSEVLPEWFGAGIPGTPGPEQAVAFQQAVDAAAGKVLRLGNGDYSIKDVTVTKECSIEGVLPNSSRLHMLGEAKFGITFNVPGLANVRLSEFLLDLNPEAQVGLDFPRGLTNGLISRLILSGKGQGAGLAIRGAGPDGKMNNNAYQNRIEGCKFYNLDRGIWLDGQDAPGGRINLNTIRSSVFTHNRLHIELTNGSSNLFEANNMNPVVGTGTVRVLVSGPHGSNLFLSNYWDEMGQQLCVHHVGFEDLGQYVALSVVNDNQPAERFRIDPGPKAARTRTGRAAAIQSFGMFGAPSAGR
jgi:hypothetical protein